MRRATRRPTRCSAPPALGDIGRHFPDTDPQWKGASSIDAARARRRRWCARRASTSSTSTSSSILERPRIAPFIDRRSAQGLADALGIDVALREREGQEQRRRGRRRPRRGDRRARRGAACVESVPDRGVEVIDASALRSEPDRSAARRQRAHRAVQLAARARQGRHARPAHRGHRHRAVDARVRGEHPRGPALARACTGTRARTSAAPHGPYRQSERLHLYASYANELLAGGHAYYCFCSPTKLEDDRRQDLAAGRPPKYRGTCRESAARRGARAHRRRRARRSSASGCPSSVEVSFQDLVRGEVTFSSEVIGDPVLVRSDGRPAYNFAVVVDDALMEITHVIRGEDHISNTPRQVLLYQALGFTPPAFAHLALVMGPDHTPLSKRHGATSVAEFRGARLSARGADELPRADRLVARAATRSCCRSTSWRGGSRSRTSATAPASSTRRSSRG